MKRIIAFAFKVKGYPKEDKTFKEMQSYYVYHNKDLPHEKRNHADNLIYQHTALRSILYPRFS